MFMIFNRDGKVSSLRISLSVFGLGVLLVVAAVISYFVDQASYRTPLEIEPFPGSVYAGTIEGNASSNEVYYRVAGGNPEAVVAHYNKLYDQSRFRDISEERCLRYPPAGNYPAFDQGREVPPYQYICLYQRNGLRASHVTEVTIQPGIKDREGSVIILHNQAWQP
ncbi:MAG: hypothetical protein ACOYLB_03240 [Phototrophicaceae bacterium]